MKIDFCFPNILLTISCFIHFGFLFCVTVLVDVEEAEAYMAEMADIEPDGEELKNVTGGAGCYGECPSND